MRIDCSEAVWLSLIFVASLQAQSHKSDQAANSAPQSTSSHNDATRAANHSNTQDASYVIGPDDLLDIRVFKEPDLSLNSVRVRPDGKISVPLLNDIRAEGLTPVQLGNAITEGLRKYVTEPKVTVIVIQNTGQRVYVVGEVGHPGPVAMLPGMTVVQALAIAGGFTDYANRKGTYILRTENGKATLHHFNYKKAIRGDADQNVELKDGDTIVVP
jgi:polysaccharide export outer membrane protein